MIAVTGIGGIGKTQLVLELAYRMREKLKHCLVLWIPATDMESLHQAYTHIAQRLRIPSWDDEKTDVKRLVQRYLSLESAGQWLLIFDNADDVHLWITGPGSRVGGIGLTEYLPKSKQCLHHAIRRHAAKLGLQKIIEVPEIDQDIAQRLLQKCLTDKSLIIERQKTDLLLKELAYLPIAIVLAAA